MMKFSRTQHQCFRLPIEYESGPIPCLSSQLVGIVTVIPHSISTSYTRARYDRPLAWVMDSSGSTRWMRRLQADPQPLISMNLHNLRERPVLLQYHYALPLLCTFEATPIHANPENASQRRKNPDAMADPIFYILFGASFRKKKVEIFMECLI